MYLVCIIYVYCTFMYFYCISIVCQFCVHYLFMCFLKGIFYSDLSMEDVMLHFYQELVVTSQIQGIKTHCGFCIISEGLYCFFCEIILVLSSI